MTSQLIKITLSLAFVNLMVACGESQTKIDQKFLVEAFKIKNDGVNIRKYKNTSFLVGKVPARNIGYAEDGDLKATLGCFDWVYQMPNDSSETESHICIYYVYGPKGGGGRIWWRGDAESFKGLMEKQGFKS